MWRLCFWLVSGSKLQEETSKNISPQKDLHSPDVIELLEFETYEENNGFKHENSKEERCGMKRISYQLTEDNFKEENKSHNKYKTERDMAITLVAISLMFVLCQSVKLVPDIYELIVCDHVKIYEKGYDPDCQNPVAIDSVASLGNLFCCINSAVNFLLYMIRGRKFRDAFYNTYFSRRKKNLNKSSSNQKSDKTTTSQLQL